MDNSEIINTETQETPEPSVVSVHPKSNKWVKIVLLGVFGVIAVGSLVFAGDKLGQKKTETKVLQPSPASFPTVTSAPNPMPKTSPT